MRLSDRFRQCVGALRNSNGDAVGTFFVIQEGLAGWWGAPENIDTIRWMITTRHTVEHYKSLTARMSPIGWSGAPIEWHVPKWHWPTGGDLSKNDPGWDIAVAPFEPTGSGGMLLSKYRYAAVPIALKVPRPQMELGLPIYLAGLLRWDDRKNRDTYSVVRSATIASMDEPDLAWDDEDDDTWFRANTVDLLDTRADQGASGAPTFVQFYVYGGWKTPAWSNWSPIWDKLAGINKSPEEVEGMGPVETFTHWHGMYAAWDDRRRIGIAISAQDIIGFIASEEMKAVRDKEIDKAKDSEAEKRKRGSGPKAARREDDTPPTTREAFFDDLERASKPYPPDKSDPEE